ncbi:MAG: hypothetical protein JSS38_13535 [Nitrospira sp.]|nr:hypothetical protein [Nitrospira sp.]MBS0155615.1 hypothetical protein [Nitrospira sp.]MBS0167742.1 hypothetical protein [Nitrospira sp.]
MRALVILIAAGLLLACGVVGSPVPPEYVGVAPTIEKQKSQHALQAERDAADVAVPDLSLEGHDIGLPPSQPVGTR